MSGANLNINFLGSSDTGSDVLVSTIVGLLSNVSGPTDATVCLLPEVSGDVMGLNKRP